MTLKPELKLPEQKIASLSFCGTSPRAFDNWIAHLPVANIGETSRLLYHGIVELNQLTIPPQQRLQLLELIRPRVTFICNELSRHYLGLSIALPEKKRKVANLSQALQLHLATGYKTVLMEQLESGAVEKNRKTITTSCHRIISELSRTILRAHQLYCSSPARSWFDCHQVYRFAHHNRLHNITVADDTLVHQGSSAVEDAYKRIVLLGCSRPNQLRQNELSTLYDLYEGWTPLVHCVDTATDTTLFVINPDQDSPPTYRSLTSGETASTGFALDTAELSGRLTEYLNQKATRKTGAVTDLPITAKASDTLLMHTIQALGVHTQRNFKRMTARGALEVAVGLTGAHYFIAGERTFKNFVKASGSPQNDDDNPFLRQAPSRHDPWAGIHDTAPHADIPASADTPITYRSGNGTAQCDGTGQKHSRIYQAPLVNTCPGGYCVNWNDEMPPALQTGEVLAIRERPEYPWSVAVIRWIRQQRNDGTQLGIELLAPSATPCGVRLIQKVGNSSELLRCLLLPENTAANQSATLITPRLPFQEGSRIELVDGGQEITGQLVQRLTATGSISQFALRMQQRVIEAPEISEYTAGTSEDEFNSLWPSL